MEASTIYEHVSRYVGAEGDGQTGGGAFDDGQTMVAAMLGRVAAALRYTTSRVERDNMGLVQGIALEVLCAHVPMFNPVRSFVQNQLYDENDHMQVPLKQTALFLVSGALVAYAVYAHEARADQTALYVCALAAFYAGTYQLTDIVCQERETMLQHEDTDDDTDAGGRAALTRPSVAARAGITSHPDPRRAPRRRAARPGGTRMLDRLPPDMLQEVLGHLRTRWGHWARSCRPCREASAPPEALWAPLAASLGWEEGGGAARRPDRRGRTPWSGAAPTGAGSTGAPPRSSSRNLWWVSVRRWVSGVGISWVARCVACGVDPGTCPMVASRLRRRRRGACAYEGADCRVSGRYEIESGMRIRVTRRGRAMVLPSGRRVPLRATYEPGEYRADAVPGGTVYLGGQRCRNVMAATAPGTDAPGRALRHPGAGGRRRGVRPGGPLGRPRERQPPQRVQVRADAGALHQVRGAVRLLAHLQVRPRRPRAPAARAGGRPPPLANGRHGVRPAGRRPDPGLAPQPVGRGAAAPPAQAHGGLLRPLPGWGAAPGPLSPGGGGHYSELLRDLAPPAVANLGGFRAAFDRLTCGVFGAASCGGTAWSAPAVP